MVGKVEGENTGQPEISKIPTSDQVFMRAVETAQASPFDAKSFFKDAAILCRRGDANATYNPDDKTLEMSNTLNYLRTVAEQHPDEIWEAFGALLEKAPYREGFHTPQRKLLARTFLLLTRDETEIQGGLRELAKEKDIEVGTGDLLEMNNTQFRVADGDNNLFSPQARADLNQVLGSVPREIVNEQIDSLSREDPVAPLKDTILGRFLSHDPQDPDKTITLTLTPEQLKDYFRSKPWEAFRLDYGLTRRTDKATQAAVYGGVSSLKKRYLKKMLEINPFLALQTGEGMLSLKDWSRDKIPPNHSKIIIETIKSLTPEQVEAHLDTNPQDILKIVPANLTHLDGEALETLKQEAGKLRFDLREEEQPEEVQETSTTATSSEIEKTVALMRDTGVSEEDIEQYQASLQGNNDIAVANIQPSSAETTTDDIKVPTIVFGLNGEVLPEIKQLFGRQVEYTIPSGKPEDTKTFQGTIFGAQNYAGEPCYLVKTADNRVRFVQPKNMSFLELTAEEQQALREETINLGKDITPKHGVSEKNIWTFYEQSQQKPEGQGE